MRLALLLFVVSCSPAYVAGNYTIAITNKENGCHYANWTDGQMTSGIPFTISQTGDMVTGQVGGLAGAYVTVILGANAFTGTVSGSSFVMDLTGRAGAQGNCAYTTHAQITGSISGDAITGTLRYTDQTNNGTDCGDLNTCESSQAFTGVRPPM
jgi:hypothetical protein